MSSTTPKSIRFHLVSILFSSLVRQRLTMVIACAFGSLWAISPVQQALAADVAYTLAAEKPVENTAPIRVALAASAAATSTNPLNNTSAITTTPLLPSELRPVLPAQTSASPNAVTTRTTSITSTVAITLPQSLTDTVTLTTTAVADATASDGAATGATVDDAVYANVISGTVVANRTQSQVRFFVEGAMYTLDALRSLGIQLPRPSAALNLYNCDSKIPEEQQGCFWDPYLLDRDGFYEIITGSDAGQVVSLVLRKAGAPPASQVWVQNRTGRSETVFLNGAAYEIAPAVIQEFETPENTPVLLYLRNCASVSAERVCEWIPRSAKAGSYYALVKIESATALTNSLVSTLDLQPVLGDVNSPAQAATAQPSPQPASSLVCRTLVPAINVRSGPGLQYTIVQKVRTGNANEPATFAAIGRSEDGQWLAVSEQIVAGGWVIAGNNFVQCDGDIGALPVVEATIAQLIPTPVAGQGPTQPPSGAPSGASSEIAPSDAPSAQSSVPLTPTLDSGAPAGLSVLVVNNGFDKQIRFTIDQRYRVDVGASEYDLEPGQSLRFVVYPGTITFSVSSPWRTLNANAEVLIERDQSRVLWVTFVPDEGEPGAWELRY